MMHKQIISVAVAAALAAPLAVQADVKLSGAIQGEIGSVEAGSAVAGLLGVSDKVKSDGSTDRFTVSSDNTGALGLGGGPNRITFDIDEDLGGGLKAYAALDWGFDTTQDANGSNMTSREKYVGFKSSTGAYFRMGRIQGAYKTATKIDPFYSTGAQMRCGGGESCLDAFTHSGFIDNVFEVGFNNSGFKVALQGVFDEATNMDGSYLADVEYGNDMFTVFGAYANKASVGSDDTANWKVGGKFNFAGASLGLQYEDTEMGSGYMGSPEGQFISLSASYAIKNVILGAWVGSFVENSDENNDTPDDLGDVSDEISNIGDTLSDFGDSMSYSLGAIYAFGKRTIVYAAYHSTDSDSKAAGSDEAYDWDAFAAGVRHSF